MKKSILISLLIISVFTLASCWETKEEKQLEEVGKVMEQQNNIQNDMVELAQKNADWTISDEDYEKEMDKLNEWFEEIDKNIQVSSEKLSEGDFPSWAKKLGLKKLKWLTFEEDESEIVESSSEAWFDGVNVIYTSDDYEKIINEAEGLASDLNIIESELSPRKSMWSIEWMMWWMWVNDEQMKQMKLNMAENMWWAMFANCILWMTCKETDEFAKMISVEKNDSWKWELNISIVNFKQWKIEMDKHNKN